MRSTAQVNNQSNRSDALTFFKNVKWNPAVDVVPISQPSSIAHKIQQVKFIDEYINYAQNEREKFSKLGVDVKFNQEPSDLLKLKSSLLKSIDPEVLDSERNSVAVSLIENVSKNISVGGFENAALKKYLKTQYTFAQKGEVSTADFNNIVDLAKSAPDELLDDLALSDSYLNALGDDSYLNKKVASKCKSVEVEQNIQPAKSNVMKRLKSKVDNLGECAIASVTNLYERVNSKIRSLDIDDQSRAEVVSTNGKQVLTLSEELLGEDLTMLDDKVMDDRLDDLVQDVSLEQELELSLEPRMTYHV